MTPLFLFESDNGYRVLIVRNSDIEGMVIDFRVVETIISLFVGRQVDIWLVDELKYGQSFNLKGLEVAFDPEANMLWIKNNDLLTRL